MNVESIWSESHLGGAACFYQVPAACTLMGKTIKETGKGGGRITSKCNLTRPDPLSRSALGGVCVSACARVCSNHN